MSNRLNPRQRRWLSNFLSEHPDYELKQVWSGLDSDRYLRLEGIERLPLPNLPAFENALPGYRLHTLQVQLRKYGDARKTSTHDVNTVYPHCPLDRKVTSVFPTGQLVLPIPAAVLEVPEPVNPVVVSWKPKKKAKPKLGVQLSLPVRSWHGSRTIQVAL